MTKGAWREHVSEAEMLQASQVEAANEFLATDVSSEFDGYGWLDDQGKAFDPVSRLVIDGVESYLERCGGDDPDELQFELDHALQPLDVIKDDDGYVSRFYVVDQLLAVAEDVVDYLVKFYFQSVGFALQVEIQGNGTTESDSSFVVFRMPEGAVANASSASSVAHRTAGRNEKFSKVHNLSKTGGLIALKTRGTLVCPVCGELGQVRVPAEIAQAISDWQFNPTPETQKAAFARLSVGERETLLSGVHDYCWPN